LKNTGKEGDKSIKKQTVCSRKGAITLFSKLTSKFVSVILKNPSNLLKGTLVEQAGQHLGRLNALDAWWGNTIEEVQQQAR